MKFDYIKCVNQYLYNFLLFGAILKFIKKYFLYQLPTKYQ